MTQEQEFPVSAVFAEEVAEGLASLTRCIVLISIVWGTVRFEKDESLVIGEWRQVDEMTIAVPPEIFDAYARRARGAMRDQALARSPNSAKSSK